jgi:hypothetical protein
MSAETRCDCWNRTTSSIGEPRTAVWRERAAILYANHPRVRCLFSGNSRDHEIEKVNAASRKKTPVQCQICLKILKIKHKIWITGTVARTQALLILRWKSFKTTCTLCSAVAYCCGAVAPRAVAALLGRFLPRLGPLVHSSGPFFLAARYPGTLIPGKARTRNDRTPGWGGLADWPGTNTGSGMARFYSAAAWNGPRSPKGTVASASASAAKSAATCANRGPFSRRRSSI